MLGAAGTIQQAAEAADTDPRNVKNRIAWDDTLVDEIVEMKRKLLTLADITPDRTLLEVARIAYADARDVFDENGNMVSPHEWDDDAAAAISGIDQETRREGRGDDVQLVRVAKLRKHDKMGALNFLGRQQKMIGGEGDGVSELANALADRLNAQRLPPPHLRQPAQLVEDVTPRTVVNTLSDAELAS